MKKTDVIINSSLTQTTSLLLILSLLGCLFLLTEGLFFEGFNGLTPRYELLLNGIIFLGFIFVGSFVMIFLMGIPKYLIFTDNKIQANYAIIREPKIIMKDRISTILINDKGNELIFFSGEKNYITCVGISKAIRDRISEYAGYHDIEYCRINSQTYAPIDAKIILMKRELHNK